MLNLNGFHYSRAPDENRLIEVNWMVGLFDTNSEAAFSAIVLLLVYALTPLASILVQTFSSKSEICLFPSYTAALEEVITTLVID